MIRKHKIFLKKYFFQILVAYFRWLLLNLIIFRYVIPYIMGPYSKNENSFCKVGIELTDSPYVVISMRIMTR